MNDCKTCMFRDECIIPAHERNLCNGYILDTVIDDDDEDEPYMFADESGWIGDEE